MLIKNILKAAIAFSTLISRLAEAVREYGIKRAERAKRKADQEEAQAHALRSKRRATATQEYQRQLLRIEKDADIKASKCLDCKLAADNRITELDRI